MMQTNKKRGNLRDAQMMSLSIKLEDIRDIGVQRGGYITTNPNSQKVKITNFETIVNTKRELNNESVSSKKKINKSVTQTSMKVSMETLTVITSTFSSMNTTLSSAVNSFSTPSFSTQTLPMQVSSKTTTVEVPVNAGNTKRKATSPLKSGEIGIAEAKNNDTKSPDNDVITNKKQKLNENDNESSKITDNETPSLVKESPLSSNLKAADVSSVCEDIAAPIETVQQHSVDEIKDSYDLSEKRIPLTTLNPCLVCMLCAGYFVEATTIVECLHTFCKSCIVRYLQTSKTCPTCLVVVHETEPLSNLQLDRTMQDIIDVILPHIREDEQKRKKAFYSKFEEESRKPEKRRSSTKNSKQKKKETQYNLVDVVDSFREDERINLKLNLKQVGDKNIDSEDEFEELQNRFIRCSARFTIGHVKLYIRKLYDIIKDEETQLTVECDGVALQDENILKKVFLTEWKRQGQPMVLDYILKNVQSETTESTENAYFETGTSECPRVTEMSGKLDVIDISDDESVVQSIVDQLLQTVESRVDSYDVT